MYHLLEEKHSYENIQNKNNDIEQFFKTRDIKMMFFRSSANIF